VNLTENDIIDMESKLYSIKNNLEYDGVEYYMDNPKLESKLAKERLI